MGEEDRELGDPRLRCWIHQSKDVLVVYVGAGRINYMGVGFYYGSQTSSKTFGLFEGVDIDTNVAKSFL